jgi:Lipopolysaccharide kinase (Kdo/WaaP) family
VLRADGEAIMSGSNLLHVSQSFQPIFRELGIDAETVFDHPQIVVWRKLADRENCTLDATLDDGRKIRWHVKRYPASRGATTPAENEVEGLRLLESARIPTMTLVAWGRTEDGRSFLITENLAGYEPADKILAGGFPFDRLLNATADLAASLHNAGLHHRDLYLCHFFVLPEEQTVDARLIDVARVKRLPGWLTRKRWIVKDLSQLWYSTVSLPVTDEQRDAWLKRYMEKRGENGFDAMKRAIEKKVAWIGKHDAKLRKKQPGRNVSIPSDDRSV